MSDHQAIARSAVLVEQGEAADRVYLVAKGTMKIFRSLPDGRRQITGFLGIGDIVGLPKATARWSCTAQALEDVEVCAFRRGEFEDLLRLYPVLELHLLAMAGDEIAAQHEHMVALGRRNADEKLAYFLVRLAGKSGVRDGAAAVVQLPMRRRDIADYLGLSIESVSRTFTRFRHRGLISMHDSDTIILGRPAALEHLAGIEQLHVARTIGL